MVEGVTQYKMPQKLDMLGSMDYLCFSTKGGVRGLASRIQYNKNWRTFTIRKERASGAKTEYDKIREALENDSMRPTYSFQGYIDELKKCPMGWAIAYTKDIFYLLEKGLCYIKQTGEHQKGQASFYVVCWDKISKNGFELYEECWTTNGFIPIEKKEIIKKPPQIKICKKVLISPSKNNQLSLF